MKYFKLTLIAVFALVLVLLGGGYAYLRASLPVLDGTIAVTGLSAAVRIERDEQQVATIRGASREDVARATGFLHAQERFFQMDLMRRAAAGELAALIGPAAVAADRGYRMHRLRHVAQQVLAQASAEQQGLLRSYAEGVNAGLQHLGARPFEYVLLRARPEPWRAEDSVLVLLAMYLDLQDENNLREARLERLRDLLPSAVVEFMNPPGTAWDAPLDGSRVSTPSIPGPEVIDVRRVLAGAAARTAWSEDWHEARAVGSNSWAVSGERSADGQAWIANDMHLGLGVPAIWYRARLVWTEAGQERAVIGVTLPGTPAVIAGSNGAVAWGFTNSYGDWADWVVVERDAEAPERYRTADGVRRLEEVTEIIKVKGAEPMELRIRQTIWGPILREDAKGRPLALRWVAHLPEATNLNLLELERASTLEQALDTANRAGVPVQNFLAADRAGRIGWTWVGRIPRRYGYDPGRAASWTEPGAGWQGWLAPEDYPRIVDPAEGILWTANNRVVGGEALELVGDGGYALGARARQIRDGLRAMPAPTAEDLLALQLDDRAVFLGRWRELLLGVLSAETVSADPGRTALRQAVMDWQGRASVDAVAYRLVRAYRSFLVQTVVQALTAPARAREPDLKLPELPQIEGAVWALLEAQPEHLLPPDHAGWPELLLVTADQVIERFWDEEAGFAAAAWGERNRLRMAHPLADALPLLGRWLNMPPQPLPGDIHMPRVQSPTHGASERLVVAPGAEARSLFHMPGGQSGHPLSKAYAAGHEDWVEGRPTPLLPGDPVHELVLEPSR